MGPAGTFLRRRRRDIPGKKGRTEKGVGESETTGGGKKGEGQERRLSSPFQRRQIQIEKKSPGKELEVEEEMAPSRWVCTLAQTHS